MRKFAVSASYTLSDISTAVVVNNQGGGITAGFQDGPAAVALGGGRFAAAWVSNGTGSGESIQFGIFNAATRALVPAAITDLVGGTGNLYSVSMALLSNGNVALAWAEHAGGTTTYWTAVVNGSTGAAVGAPLALASASMVGGAVSIAAKADGYVVAYSGDATPANSPAFVAGFTNAGAADPGFTTFNAIQRDLGVSELSVAVLTNGTIVVVAEGAEGPPGVVINGVGPSRPIEGSVLGFSYWNPDGTPVLREGVPVSGSHLGAFVDSRVVTAALPNGNVVIAYDSGNIVNDGNKLVVNVRGPMGEYIGGSEGFVLAPEDQLWPSIAVLGDGGFAVSWSRRLISDGSPTGTIVVTFLPDGTRALGETIRSSGTSDTAALAGFTDGRIVLVAEGGNDGAGTGIIASLTRVTETLIGTNGDETINGSSLANFINGFAGADVINGLGGDDGIAGDDSFTVGGGDVISGGDGNDTISGNAGDDTIYGGNDNDSLDGGNGNDVLHGDAGNDELFGAAGNDIIDGGAGQDTGLLSGSRAAYRVGVREGVIFTSGAEGVDSYINVEALKWGTAPSVSIASLLASPSNTGLIFGKLGSAEAGYILPEAYSGPVAGLVNQLLGGAAGDTVLGTDRADFINALAGDDAVDGGAGNDVLDGGLGSNFLTGGAGVDIFFVDGRGAASFNTWSTITDFSAGEQVTIWGYQPGVSQFLWVASDGAPGFQGATMHSDLDGNGLIDTSVTFTGKTEAELPVPTYGSVAGQDYIFFG